MVAASSGRASEEASEAARGAADLPDFALTELF